MFVSGNALSGRHQKPDTPPIVAAVTVTPRAGTIASFFASNARRASTPSGVPLVAARASRFARAGAMSRGSRGCSNSMASLLSSRVHRHVQFAAFFEHLADVLFGDLAIARAGKRIPE